MRTSKLAYVLGLLFSVSALAQQTPPFPPAPPGNDMVVATPGPGKMIIRHEMGEWWKNSETVKKLQLSDSQIAQLDQTFYDHKMKLIDYGAEMEKADLKLQNLLDADVPNEGQVGAQVDKVLAARGKLEREFTMMDLDLRKVLSVEQWRQLKTIRGQRGLPGDFFFYRRLQPGSPPPGPGAELLPPPPPEPPSEDTF
jgi:Spy/CpxP family protein refolding chaperone